MLLDRGFKPENIITMIEDDVADHRNNPFPGKLFTRPSEGEGQEFYQNLVIDYNLGDVTAKQIEAVLLGDRELVKNTGSGRVLESTENDEVFFYYSDHGSKGLVLLPRHKYWYADEIVGNFLKMKEIGKFRNLLIFIDACHSGSLFAKLPEDQNIYALTSSHPNEVAYMKYCGSEARVNGRSIGSCMTSEFSDFSLVLLEDSDKKQTVKEMFEEIKNKLWRRQKTMEYGDQRVANMAAEIFLGKLSTSSSRRLVERRVESQNVRALNMNELESIFEEYKTAPSEENHFMLQSELKAIENIQKVSQLIQREIEDLDVENTESTNFDCYRRLINTYESNCGQLTSAALEYLDTFYAACQSNEVALTGRNFAGIFQHVCQL